MSSAMKVLFFLRRTGPYHHARFQAATSLLHLCVAETRPESAEYAWNFEGSGDYQVIRFAKGPDIEKGLRGKELKKNVKDAIEFFLPQVIVTTGWADAEYHEVVLQAKSRNIPLVVISDSRWEDEIRVGWKELLKRLILKSYSSALVAGSASQRYLLKLDFAREAIFHPWDVVDNEYFSKAKKEYSFDNRSFLCLSRFIPKKNLPFLIQGYSRYVNSGGKRNLILAGSGEEEYVLKRLISELHLNERIQLPGFVQYEELPCLFERSFCLILPSLTDQWGLVVNEAMAAGLPVLVSDRCGCAEDVVKESLNGRTFDPENVSAFTDLLTWIDKKNEQDWNMLSKEAYVTIQKWSLQQFAGSLKQAAAFAVDHKAPGGLRIIHQLLSR